MTEQPFVSSRFLLRDKPASYPYYDLILQDTQGPVFDLNVDMDSYDGSVYLLPEHVIEMARTLGMATVEEVAQLRATITELRRQINKLPKAQEELKSGLDDLTARFYASLNTVDSESPVGDTEPESDNREVEETEREAERPIVL